MVRRRRDETGINYKKRIPRIIAINQTAQEKRIYEKICTLLKEKYFTNLGKEINGRLIIIANDEKYSIDTRQFAYEILEDYKDLKKDSKMEKLVEIIDKTLKKDKDAKVLIYTKHPTTLRYMVERLPKDLKITEFMGGLTREEKSEKIKEFKENSQILISTDTGAEGLNLQFCYTLINYDLPWNPMSVEQRIGRLDRIGQTHDMDIYSFATKGTMEEYVVDLIINKMCCVGLVIGELPIILFNLGLDSRGKAGANKIEESLLNSFIDSKNNLSLFARDVDEINRMIQEGIEKYNESKESTSELIDDVKN
jgi:SNF2 family DNA or RNA helicase